MPLNYQHIHQKVREIGSNAMERKQHLDSLRERAQRCLQANAAQVDNLRRIISRALEYDPNLRCALPEEEALDTSVAVPALTESATLIAADGSQVAPDRHAPVQYCLVNVGAVVMQLDSGQPPMVCVDSQLLYDQEIYTETGMLTDEAIAMQRDIAERRKLLDLVKREEGVIVTLTDGPVELWGAKDSSSRDYRRNLEAHKAVLSQLHAQEVITAGYVDKPGANLVLRTLELTLLNPEEMKEIRKTHPLRGVTDRWLYGQLLPAGNRSAVFGLQSSSRAHYTEILGLHFFYLNVGDDEHPWIVRVEFPAWVAQSAERLDILQAVLLQQCAIMGAKPYPYVLHRAHELAVVSYVEKVQLEQMLQIELRGKEVEVGDVSSKQSAKNLPKRTWQH